jgi:SAM-dependent methyltransferase
VSTSPERAHWESIGDEWIRTRPQDLWREYCDRINDSVLRPWLSPKTHRRVLKTDLFDEAVGRRGLAPLLTESAATVVGIDLSAGITRAARDRQDGAVRVARADVRRLPFRDGSFDVVVSTSTLDHFPSLDQVGVALFELHRVLAPGGELLLTLDNGANPVVRLRGVLPIELLQRIRVVPYYVGATCGPKRLAELVADAGFRLESISASMHVPRLPAVWLARAIARIGSPAARDRFVSAMIAFDRLGRFSTRYLTGYFLVVRARKP